MSTSEKLFRIIFHKHSFLNLSGIMENLQTLLEGKEIVASTNEKKINEADLAQAAQETLKEIEEIFRNHKDSLEIMMQLQKELALITSFAKKHSSKESAHLWNEAVKAINESEKKSLHSLKKYSNLTNSKKTKVLNFIKEHQEKNHVPNNIKSILEHDKKEIKNIQSSYVQYHRHEKDNLTAEAELLTLPGKHLTKSSSNSKGF